MSRVDPVETQSNVDIVLFASDAIDQHASRTLSWVLATSDIGATDMTRLLQRAIYSCYVDGVYILLAHGACPSSAVDVALWPGLSWDWWLFLLDPRTQAYVYDHMDAEVRSAIGHAPPPLVYALLHSRAEGVSGSILHDIVRQLVEVGADVHAYDGLALTLAVWHLDVDVVRVLLAAGARADGPRIVALLAQCHHPHDYAEVLDVMDVLCEFRVDMDRAGELALVYYASRGMTARVGAFLNRGPVGQDTLDDALVEAAEGQHLAVVRLLIGARANTSAHACEALMCALTNDDFDMARELVRVGICDAAGYNRVWRHAFAEVHNGSVQLLQFLLGAAPWMVYEIIHWTDRQFPLPIIECLILHDMERFDEMVRTDVLVADARVAALSQDVTARLHTIITALMERAHAPLTEDLTLIVLCMSGFTYATALYVLELYYGGRAFDDCALHQGSERVDQAWTRTLQRLANRKTKMRRMGHGHHLVHVSPVDTPSDSVVFV